MHPLSDKRMKFPPSPLPITTTTTTTYLERTKFPHCHPCSGQFLPSSRYPLSTRSSLSRILPADACNSPMLNATFTSLLTFVGFRTRSLPSSLAPLTRSLPPRDDLWTVYTSSTSTCVYRARTRSLSTRVNHDSEGFEGTTEERVTMRTGRPKIGRHACMRGFAGPSRISDVLWMTGRAL